MPSFSLQLRFPANTVNHLEVIYPYIGVSDDWARGSAGITYAFTIELPPKGSTHGLPGFELPADRILPVGRETFAGISAMLTKLLNDTAGK